MHKKQNRPTTGRDAINDVVGELVDFVRRRGYVRGDRLPPIRQLADALGMGRNAVRDAVLQAQAMGLVRVEPRLGVFVQDPDAGLAGDGPARGQGPTWGQSSAQPPEPALGPALERETGHVFHWIDARLVVELELVGKAARAGHAEELLPLRQALEAVLADREDRSDFIAADEAFHLEIARLAGNPVLLAFLRTLLERLRSDKQGVLLSAENRKRTDREHVELYRSILEGRPEQAQAVLREHIDYGRALLLERLRTVPTARPSTAKPRGVKTSRRVRDGR